MLVEILRIWIQVPSLSDNLKEGIAKVNANIMTKTQKVQSLNNERIAESE
jgi:hypothetical protein